MPVVSDGVVITGVFGVGKSSVVEEIAHVLERRGTAFAALDLDWLRWFDRGDGAETATDPLFFANLAGVIGNYRAGGIDRFVMAAALSGATELAALTTALAFSPAVVRLTLPRHVIASRLATNPTSGRREDLRAAETWLEHGIGEELGQLVLPNDGHLRATVEQILNWLGWC